MIKRQAFPYFGGKARVADEVWRRFGDDRTGYLDPFAGSLAMLLRNPHADRMKSETVNDLNGFIANFWRAVAAAPDVVASHCDWPVNQLDLKARHDVLAGMAVGLRDRLAADPDYYDAKVAGWWVWGISQWIGSGWCDAKPANKRPHLADHGRGVHSLGQRPHLADHGRGVHSLGQRPHLGDHGMGVHSLGQRPHLADHGRGGFYDLYTDIAARIRFTRVSCCDWSSLRSTLHKSAQWAVFLDPPYTAASGRDASLYREGATGDAHLSLGHDVAEWARQIGDEHRVALCGIEGEYEMPGWDVWSWKTGGYSYGGRKRGEVIWFSPACLR